jgi:hypothetical protein
VLEEIGKPDALRAHVEVVVDVDAARLEVATSQGQVVHRVARGVARDPGGLEEAEIVGQGVEQSPIVCALDRRGPP